MKRCSPQRYTVASLIFGIACLLAACQEGPPSQPMGTTSPGPIMGPEATASQLVLPAVEPKATGQPLPAGTLEAAEPTAQAEMGKLVFTSNRSELRAQEPGDIYVAQADGSSLTKLTQQPAIYEHPPFMPVTSPKDARNKVHGVLDAGADLIKIAFEDSLPPGQRPVLLQLPEARAIVETAHARGVPVVAHVTYARHLELAVEAGVDEVTHMIRDALPDELVARMIEQDIAILITVQEVIAKGGRHDEVDLYGQPGGYARLMDRRAAGQPCPTCSTLVEKIQYLGGACYFCPRCQA